jgi:hypothetical protein
MEEPTSPKEDFHKTVKGIRVYAKFPRRFKNRPVPDRKNGRCRTLPKKEVAYRERELIERGDDINPVHTKELEMETKSRMSKLALILLGTGASMTIEMSLVPSKALKSLLDLFSRKQLRELAKKADIPRGSNKVDTIRNLIQNTYRL